MQRHPLLAAAILAGLLFSIHPAMAFKVDDKTGNNPDGTARFFDTDDVKPSTGLEVKPSSSWSFGVQGQSSNDSFDRNSPSLLTNPSFSGTPFQSQIPNSVFVNPTRRR
jgi:hypothetical protein